jgi:lipopolysaccharide export LptBFGC system permease protein LptF
MKITAIIMMILSLTLTSCASYSLEDIVENLTDNTTREEIFSMIPENPDTGGTDDGLIIYEGLEAYGHKNVDVWFMSQNHIISSVSVYIEKPYKNHNMHIKEYNKIRKRLTRKFGKPTSTRDSSNETEINLSNLWLDENKRQFHLSIQYSADNPITDDDGIPAVSIFIWVINSSK